MGSSCFISAMLQFKKSKGLQNITVKIIRNSLFPKNNFDLHSILKSILRPTAHVHHPNRIWAREGPILGRLWPELDIPDQNSMISKKDGPKPYLSIRRLKYENLDRSVRRAFMDLGLKLRISEVLAN